MRRIGWAVCLLAIVCPTDVFQAARASDGPRLEDRAADDVDRILGQWQERMSSVTSIEVKFRRTSGSNTPVERKAEGRLILVAPHHALFEETSIQYGGKPSSDRSKQVWTGRDFLSFSHENDEVSRFRRSDDRTVPPVPLCLPFFYRLSLERARERYEWRLLGARGDRVWLEAASKDKGAASSWPSRYCIELERASWLPRRVIVFDRDRERDTYELLDVKLDARVDEDWKDPCLDAWKVVEPIDWLTRRLSP